MRWRACLLRKRPHELVVYVAIPWRIICGFVDGVVDCFANVRFELDAHDVGVVWWFEAEQSCWRQRSKIVCRGVESLSLACLISGVLRNEVPAKIAHGDSSRLQFGGCSFGGFDHALFAVHEETEGDHAFRAFLAESIHKVVNGCLDVGGHG